jgi:hypothetical protein
VLSIYIEGSVCKMKPIDEGDSPYRGRLLEACLTRGEDTSMSKDNRYLPPEFMRDSPLIDPAVRRSKCKRPNAFKHGVYATPTLIPGENRKEFEELLAELLDEYKPLGPSLRHAVHCLADSMWRLRRLKKSVQTELYVNTFDPHHPTFNEAWGFAMFLSRLRAEPETCFKQYAKKYLRRDKIDDLEQKFPRTDYQSTAEWAKAITTEILSGLLPAKPQLEAPELGYRADELEQALREWRTDQQLVGSIAHARELLEYELKETERLNAMIVKQTRHCAELKAWEEAEKARSKT